MATKNVLLLIADDLGFQVGCYGDPLTQTPNLDDLAARGVKFTKAFASTASCSGSRTTIYTGLHTHHNGQYGLASHRHHFQTFDHVDSAPAILSRHGYLTGIIGKVHVGPKEVYPWEVREESDTRDVAITADRCAAFFERSKSENRPFFLTVGFPRPTSRPHACRVRKHGPVRRESPGGQIFPGPDRGPQLPPRFGWHPAGACQLLRSHQPARPGRRLHPRQPRSGRPPGRHACHLPQRQRPAFHQLQDHTLRRWGESPLHRGLAFRIRTWSRR